MPIHIRRKLFIKGKTKKIRVMPIRKTKSGGYKWGTSGKVYKSRAKAIKQMKAIYASGYKKK